MNFIDFLSLLPFYVSMMFLALGDYDDIGKVGKIIRLMKVIGENGRSLRRSRNRSITISCMQVMRILRVYKLFRHFAGLQALLYTLKQAYKELGLLLIIICICLANCICICTYIAGVMILSFASLVYLCETELSDGVEVMWRNQTLVVPHKDTWGFPECFWWAQDEDDGDDDKNRWALMTITTVGYDTSPRFVVVVCYCYLTPRTLLGNIFAGFCALVGVFSLTLPIPIVVNSFAGFYKNRLWRNEVRRRNGKELKDFFSLQGPVDISLNGSHIIDKWDKFRYIS